METSGVLLYTLNRPKSLNALNIEQVIHMDKQLRGLHSDPAIKAIVFTGEGDKAFCAGGDVLQIAKSAAETRSDWNRRWFSSEFLLNHFISTIEKPVVSLWKGIVMGGGVGLSIYGSHRIATDSTVFAMPETSIGFFPDVGGSYFLSHYVKQPGLGLYLGMTGHRLTSGDTVHCGLATHYVEQSKLETLKSALCVTSDLSSMIDQFTSEPPRTLADDFLRSVAHYFGSHTSFTEFLKELQDGVDRKDEFAVNTMKTIRSKCPLTVRVWFESFRLGARQSLSEVLEREYHMCIQVTEVDSHNFTEGVRALLIDKGKGAPPDYRPKTLEEVTDKMVFEIVEASPGGDMKSCLREGRLMYG
jgi:enoyl-CoA hydratase